ncbi:MAG: gliding motility-associated C-terminal domain-containing protein [Bacteroidales bacterium]|jgi:gliding motility-associated-like protein|nr:gliding motility-associated C-terminal domain-containing protein [Bacteroidales bacterium]
MMADNIRRIILFFFFSAPFFLAAQTIPTANLCGYWSLDGNVYDASGNVNHGELHGAATYCPDRFGVPDKAVKLGGFLNPSAIRVPNSPSLHLDHELTIACWFKLDDAGGMDIWGDFTTTTQTLHNFVNKDGKKSGFILNYSFDFTTETQGFNFAIINTPGCVTTVADFAYDDIQSCINTEWRHMAVVVDSISITVYVNGMQKHRQTYNSQINFTEANERDLYFGRYGYNCGMSNYWYPLNGRLDDIVYYNRALSQAEINELFNYPVPYAPLAMVRDTIEDVVAVGDVYENNGFSLPAQNEPGLHTYSRTNGCDSIWILNLLVIDPCEGLQDAIIVSGLVAWYPFNGNADDGTMNLNHGVIHGATLIADRHGNPSSACHFDGVDDYIEIPNAPQLSALTTDFTVSFWVKSSSTDIAPFCKSAVNALPVQFGIHSLYNSQTNATEISILCNGNEFLFEYELPTDEWYQIVMIFEQNSCRLLVNNSEVPVAGTLPAGFPFSSDNDLYIGKDPHDATEYHSGEVDDIRIYSRVLSSGEISILYQGGVEISDTICLGESYNDNGFSLPAQTIAGDFEHTLNLQNIMGCDSTVTLHFTVKPLNEKIINDTICLGETRNFYGTDVNANDTYTVTVSGQECDTVIILHLIVNQTYNDTLNISICEGESYLFNGNSYDATGIHTDSLQTTAGCDSIVTLCLTVNSNSTYGFVDTICEGQPYNKNGFLLPAQAAAGDFEHTLDLQNVRGCDSTVTLYLTVEPASIYEYADTICEGQPYNNNGFSLPAQTATGNFEHRQDLQNLYDCDSTVILNLTIKPLNVKTVNDTICLGETYDFYGDELNAAGTYTDTVSGPECDTVVTLHLAVNQSDDILNISICEGESYLFDGINYEATGIYTAHFQNSRGCDSAVTLNLTVEPLNTKTITHAICPDETYNFYGTGINTAGTYTITVSGPECDTVVTLHLAINPIYNDTLNISICEGKSYLFNGNSYDTAGIHTANLQTAAGCDSTVTLNLTVKPLNTKTIHDTICANETCNFYGEELNTAGTYIDTVSGPECDTVVTLHLAVNQTYRDTLNVSIYESESYLFAGNSYSTTGTYTANLQTVQGCDSIWVLNLNVMGLYHPFSHAYIACPGTSVNMGFNAITGVEYYWYTGETGGVPIGGNPSDTLTVIKDQTPVQTWWVEAFFNGITSPRYQVDLELSDNCGVINPVGCAATGTILFKEDFDSYGDGLNSLSPNFSTEPLPAGRTTYGFVSSNIDPTDGNYALAKYAYGNLVWSLSNDCNPQNDSTTGRFMLVNADYAPKVFYRQSITNLCSGSLLYFSAMIANCHLEPYQGLKPNLSYFLLDSLTSEVIASFHTGDIPNATHAIDWRQWGFSFLIPPNINSLVLEIKNNQVGGLGNDLGLDNIEIRLCVPPVTLTQPAGRDTAMCTGNSLTFEGVYTDDGTFTSGGNDLVYRWEHSSTGDINNPTAWTAIAATQGTSATGNLTGTYTLGAITVADSGYYRLVVSNADNINNSNCRAVSEIVHLRTIQSVVSGTVSANQTVCYDSIPATLTSTAASAGSLDLTYQWQQRINGGTAWTSVTAGTGETTLNYTPPALSQTMQYRLITTGGMVFCQTDTSNAVTVTALPLVDPVAIDTAICQGSTYSFNGSTFSTTGIYVAHLATANGCDSTVTLHLTVKPNTIYEYADTVCIGETYSYNGFSLPAQTVAGNFAHERHLPNYLGCDSTVMLHLTVQAANIKTVNAAICWNEIYSFYGEELNAAGTYTDTISGPKCDTVVTLHLTVNQTYNDTLNISICEGESYLFAGNSYNTAGTHTASLQTATGCDSIVTLHLTVNTSYSIQIEDVCCMDETYQKYGFQLPPSQSPGIYEHVQHLQSATGCDSTVTIWLTVPNVSVEIDMTPEDFCEKYYTVLTAVTNNIDIEWNTGEVSQSITVTERGNYTVTVTDTSAICKATDVVEIAPCNPLLLLPNAVTPGNADGINDYFRLANPEAFEAIEIHVYNRWGNCVFSSQDPHFSWDGRFKGTLQTGQIFSYVIYYTPVQDRKQVYAGHITVL